MSSGTIMIADSVVDTIKFDVVKTETDEVVKTNGAPVSPSFDFISMPSGIGFKQNLEIVEGDTIDYVVQQVIKKKNIKLTLYWKGAKAYQKYQSFNNWVAMYIDVAKYHLRFSYELGGLRRYVEVSAIDLSLEGRDGSITSAVLTLQPLTLWYEEETISFMMVSDTSSGKIYDYKYPYNYGGGSYSDSNVVENKFIKKMPLKIVIKGPAASPIMVSISKVDENGNVESEYSRVQFVSGFELTSDQTLTIDAFNNRIYKTTKNPNTGIVTIDDAFNSVNKVYDSFLYAEPGSSKIASNALATENSSLTCSYKRYVL